MSAPTAEGRTGRIGWTVPPGPSILDMMWSRLVDETYALLKIIEQARDDSGWSEELQKEHCRGMAEMIAILLNPYSPNIDEVRAEVMRRIGEREQ